MTLRAAQLPRPSQPGLHCLPDGTHRSETPPISSHLETVEDACIPRLTMADSPADGRGLLPALRDGLQVSGLAYPKQVGGKSQSSHHRQMVPPVPLFEDFPANASNIDHLATAGSI